jgi:hypothetical protein
MDEAERLKEAQKTMTVAGLKVEPPEIRDFGSIKTCPKCNQLGCYIYSPFEITYQAVFERLDIRCENCGWVGYTKCADAKEKE